MYGTGDSEVVDHIYVLEDDDLEEAGFLKDTDQLWHGGGITDGANSIRFN